MNNAEINALSEIVERAVLKAVSEITKDHAQDHALFPLSDTKRVSRIFNVSPWTVRQWVRQGLLNANYQLVSGRVVKLVFTNRALCQFFHDNFPSVADLHESPFHPKSSRAQRIKHILTMKQIYARRRSR